MADTCEIHRGPCTCNGAEGTSQASLTSLSGNTAFSVSSRLCASSSLLHPEDPNRPAPIPFRRAAFNSHAAAQPCSRAPSASQPRPGAPAATAAVPALTYDARGPSRPDTRGASASADPTAATRTSRNRQPSTRSPRLAAAQRASGRPRGGTLTPSSSASISTVHSVTRSRCRGGGVLSGAVARRGGTSAMAESPSSAASSSTFNRRNNSSGACLVLALAFCHTPVIAPEPISSAVSRSI
jgi:hypothetical protein